MKTDDARQRGGLPRRGFLRGAAGLAAAAGLWPGTVLDARAAAGRLDRETLVKRLAQMEARDDRRFVVERAETDLLYLLARLSGARQVLEIGTAHGYWTLWLACAVAETGGRVTTMELLAERRDKAREHLRLLGLERRVTFLQGDAHAMTAELKGRFDFIFLNADKAGNLDYFQKLHPRNLRPGGLLLTHNYKTRFDQMKDYVARVREHSMLDSAVLGAVAEDAFLAALDRRRG